METINFYQISIFIFQGFLVSCLILTLFHFRKITGTGLLYTTIGMFQFIQVFLASTIYFEISDGIIISPGSSILFSVSLFTILLFYIKEDAIIARRLIYSLVTANFVLAILLALFQLNIESSETFNSFNVSDNFFNTNAFILVFGTFVLFIDSILIIFIFEFISKYISSIFFRIYFTMTIVLCFDAMFFSLGGFWDSENLYSILISGLISKSVIALYYSILFTIYLRYIQQDIYSPKYDSFKDIYHSLTYRQKFEQAEKVIQLSKNRYQTLTDISPVGIFMTKADGKTTFVNEKWCTISGLSQNKALNDGWLKAVHPDDQKKIEENWHNDTTRKDSSSHVEYRFLRPDGTIKWVLGQAIPEFNEKNKIIGYVGTTTDITELKLYEIELSKMKEKAEESDRLKSAFLANMSHEIRTPMNGILGFSELLKEPKLSGDEKDLYIGLIEESGARMLNIIRDIIDISKIESGQVTIHHSEVDINEQVEYLYHFFKPEADRKELQLSYDCGLSGNKAIIKTDKEKFNAILTNLIKNALKYTQKGSISFGYQEEEGFLYFYIKDTGMGISMDRQEAIFERFIQADIENNYAIEGAGIGLSIAKAFTEKLGGDIWLESKKEKGSIFYFSIPYITT